MKRKRFLSITLHKNRVNGFWFFQLVLDLLKTGQLHLKFKKLKVDWPVECLPVKTGFGFLKDSWKLFWTVLDILDEKDKTVIRVNQLSIQKYIDIGMLTRG